MASEKAQQSQSVIGKTTGFFSDSWAELKKVSSPTRQETVQATIVVLVMLVVVGIYLGVLDAIFGQLMLSIFS